MARAIAGWVRSVARAISAGPASGSPRRAASRARAKSAVPWRVPPQPVIRSAAHCGRAVPVAAGARVRRAQRHRQIRPRDAEAVVPARVDPHVRARGHVAAHAAGRLRFGPMVVVARPRRTSPEGDTGRRPRCPPARSVRAMGFMAVRAGDPRAMHPALDERSPLVDLPEDLPVRVIEPGLEEGRHVGVEEGPAVRMRVHDRPPARVTAGADVELRRGPGGPRPLGDAALAVLHGPRPIAPPEPHDETGGAGGRAGRPGRPRFGPGDMGRAGPVALLAGHGQLGPGRGVAVRGLVVPFPEIRRVALGALEVPRLLTARPVKRVRGAQRHVRVEMEPPLPALGARPRVPGQPERLEPAAGQRHEVLLQGVDAEGVGDLELGGLAVGAVGPNEELAVAAEERRRDAPVRDARLVEVAEDRLVRGGLHRAGVIGAAVGLRLLGVAAGALRAADERRGRGGGGLRSLGRLVGSLAAAAEDDPASAQSQGRDAERVARTDARALLPGASRCPA